MDTVEKAERFLHPALEQLYPPLMMQDMDKAVTLLRQAIAAHQPIMIYGDYDVDGVCATSIMLETLREEGAQADYYIPSRHGEGYGLNCDAVREIETDDIPRACRLMTAAAILALLACAGVKALCIFLCNR